MRALVTKCAANVDRPALDPTGRRLVPAEIAVLLTREQIHARRRHAGHVLRSKIATGSGIAIDATKAVEPRNKVPHPGMPHIEALGAAAAATEQVSVIDIDLEERLH
ncbi:hypothetical protein [Bradyrhizobium elkanii]|uniref:hypothetical protein n=1 Tax=Bradyrhizobium elkanii TaxID=29448 RepID=UPI000F745B5E|nr:hypothetical protein [Bradyrhizobium elkanii]MCW2195078.1 hypothetical protein [Bradyrhizobium elkanii]NWL67230.1 hypothetical protein [Bradyrhizobium elkanii]